MGRVAERVGFEPTLRFPVNRISSAARSTTLPPLRGAGAGAPSVERGPLDRLRPPAQPSLVQPRAGTKFDAVMTDLQTDPSPDSAAPEAPPVAHASFSIGDVVRHRMFDFRGVVFDVDPVFNNTCLLYTSPSPRD